jgi:hypothetical protein
MAVKWRHGQTKQRTFRLINTHISTRFVNSTVLHGLLKLSAYLNTYKSVRLTTLSPDS